MKHLLTELESLNDFYQDIKDAHTDRTTKIFDNAVKCLFDNTEVKFIVWNQFAPYFNDGDPCEFSVRSLSFHYYVYDGRDNIDQYGINLNDDRSIKSIDEDSATDKILVDFLSIFRNINETYFKDRFDDDATVIISPTCVILLECEHD